MSVRLNPEMWQKILSTNGKGAQEKDPHSEAGVNEGLNGGHSVLKNRLVYMLAMEGDAPDKNWKWYEKLLDAVVQAVQPSPAMTHVELFMPVFSDDDDPHFATYLGKNSGWGKSFGDSESFYLDPHGNGPSWRAIPIMANDAVQRLRTECEQHVSTPYGAFHRLFNYPFAIPPLRSFAWAVDDETLSPAHCAILTARCLRRGLPEIGLANSSAWYGPSTLFLELSRQNRMAAYSVEFEELQTKTSTVEQEEAVRAVEVLLRGSDEKVGELDDTSCQMGIELLAKKSVTASVSGDTTVERVAQKQLARALLRYSIVQRRVARRRRLKEEFLRHKHAEHLHPVYSHAYHPPADFAASPGVAGCLDSHSDDEDDIFHENVGNKGMFRR